MKTHGTIMLIDEYYKDIEAGYLIDYDGYCVEILDENDNLLGKAKYCYPSQVSKLKKELKTEYKEAKKIIWYNR